MQNFLHDVLYIIECYVAGLVDSRNESPLHHLTIVHPIIPILSRTLLKVPSTPMGQNREKKDRIKQGDGSVEPRRQTPCQALNPIRRIINLAREGPPARSKQLIPVFRLYIGRIHDNGPRKGRESSSRFVLPLLLHLKVGLLCHRSVEDRIANEQGSEHCDLAD